MQNSKVKQLFSDMEFFSTSHRFSRRQHPRNTTHIRDRHWYGEPENAMEDRWCLYHENHRRYHRSQVQKEHQIERGGYSPPLNDGGKCFQKKDLFQNPGHRHCRLWILLLFLPGSLNSDRPLPPATTCRPPERRNTAWVQGSWYAQGCGSGGRQNPRPVAKEGSGSG